MSGSEISDMFTQIMADRPAANDNWCTPCLQYGWMSVHDCVAFAHMSGRNIWVYDVRKDGSNRRDHYYFPAKPTRRSGLGLVTLAAMRGRISANDVLLGFDGCHYAAAVPIPEYNAVKALASTPLQAANALNKHTE